MKSLSTAIALVLLIASITIAADTTLIVGGLNGLDPGSYGSSCPIGLAISGGGARGLATIGVLKAFEEKGIEVVALAGTSMGGVIGGLYACGYDADRLDEVVHNIDIAELISNRPPRSSLFLEQRRDRDRYLLSVRFDGWKPEIPQALTGGQEITSLLTRLTARADYLAKGDFTQFPIPFKTVCTDVISGELVVMSHGSLADAMRATMAFPLAFTGVRMGDRLLMDGGMLMPIPVETVREMTPAGIPIVAINTASPLIKDDALVTPIDIANQVTTVMTADKLERQLALADLVVSPVSDDITSVDFDLMDSLIQVGYQHGLNAADSICLLSHLKNDRTVYRTGKFDLVCSDSLLARRVKALGLDRPFTLSQLEQDLKTVARTEPVYDIRAELDFWPANDSAGTEPTADLRIVIRPQPRVTDIKFRFEGNSFYDDLTLADQAEFPDSTVSARDLQRTADRIVNLYAVDGYDVTEVTPRGIDFDRMEAVFDIDEAIVRRIDVKDNVRCRDWLVRSYVAMEKNRPASLKQASESLSNLYGTELFERVTFDLMPDDDSGAAVTLRVQERKYSQMRIGWHWHDEYESEQFVELLDDNVNGVGLEFLTHAQYGPERQDYHTGFRVDRIFFTHLTASLRFFYNLRDRKLYNSEGDAIGHRDEDRWGGSFYLGQQLGRLGEAKMGLVVEELDLYDHVRETSDRFGLRTINFESMLETFDRYPFPNHGSRHHAELRFAGKLLGGEVEYTRFSLSLEAYYPLGKYLNYHPHFFVGLSRRGLPSSERFYVGGQHSFAGYRSDELAGDKAVVFNQELRVKLPYRNYLIGRWDLGDVYASADDIKPGKLKHGLGIALAVDTPIGPFEIGYGGGYSPKDRLYFSAGFEF